MRTENSPPVGFNSALVGRNNVFDSGRQHHKSGGKGMGTNDYDKNLDTRAQEFGGIVCH